MSKLLVKIVMAFLFWKPAKWRKNFKGHLESALYSRTVRRNAKKCASYIKVLGPGVNVTPYTTIGHGAGFGKDVKIRGDGPVFIGRFVAIAEDTLIYTQVHDYDHSKVLPFGGGFTYPETRIDDYAWVGMRSIILPGTHIGEGAIVQAGSVVMGKIPPCAIAAGNPAKVIGWRDMEHYNSIKVAMGEKPVVVGGSGTVGDGAPKERESKPAAASTERDDRLTDIFCSVFSVSPDEAVTMTYKHHPAWDSAGQMALSAALEREFGISISPEELYRLRSYADALSLTKPKAKTGKAFFDLDREGTAVIFDESEVSFRKLKEMGERAIAGVAPRSVMLIRADNTPQTIATFAACINNGVVPLMLPTRIDNALFDKLQETYAKASVNDNLALLMSTSGSTGSPKLVRTSYANLAADCDAVEKDHDMSCGDRFMIPLPLGYAFGIAIMSACLAKGVTIVISSKDVMDPDFGDMLAGSCATHFAGVPYMYEMMDRLGFFSRQFPALRHLAISGGALGPALRRKYAQWARDAKKDFCEIYGQTETLAYMAKIVTSSRQDMVGSIGKASSGGSFSVKANGELIYKGPIVAMGYATCAEDLLKGDEWNGVRETGDVATIDAEGFVTLTGRASRFLKIFGNRVSLQEVENIVKDAFSGAGCAATGTDNDLHVFVSHTSAADVERLLVTKLHFNTTVLKVHALDEIPLNANGKTDYQGLKALCLQKK